MCIVPNTGLVLLATDESRVGTYFVPNLGIAPRWCSFLDSTTEELEETQTANVYDNLQFLTTSQVNEMGISHMTSTNLLRPYMHGYFISSSLLDKLKAMDQTWVAMDQKKQRVSDAVDSQRSMRVPIKKKKVDVNPDLAERLKDTSKGRTDKKSKTKAKGAKDILGDSRFSGLFTDPHFTIEEKK
eukprot:GHVO01033418.1.p2 GENE.GHVO01033418.1~~GHVO01033418.1.p2  ORF type:complete len:185 (-),score=45.88 GHVO01033418.1:144-698(-)